MDISFSRCTERKGTRLLRFLALEEAVDHLTKGCDGLTTFDKSRLELAICSGFADEKARCSSDPSRRASGLVCTDYGGEFTLDRDKC